MDHSSWHCYLSSYVLNHSAPRPLIFAFRVWIKPSTKFSGRHKCVLVGGNVGGSEGASSRSERTSDVPTFWKWWYLQKWKNHRALDLDQQILVLIPSLFLCRCTSWAVIFSACFSDLLSGARFWIPAQCPTQWIPTLAIHQNHLGTCIYQRPERNQASQLCKALQVMLEYSWNWEMLHRVEPH